MNAAWLTTPNVATFLIASLLLAITPGPGVIYLLTQTLTRGRRAGFASVAGIALGNLGNLAAASFGLAAVFAASATAFLVIKFAGAAYLVFLGIQALRTKATLETAPHVGCRAPRRLFRDGFFVALLNPKTALFFAALLPQFMNPSMPPLGQSLVFGGVFVATALCTDTLYVLTAAAVAGKLRRRAASRRYGKYLSAASFIGLGIYAALTNPRGSR